MSKNKNKKISESKDKTSLIYGIILFVISFVLYANTIGHDYTLDDYMLIKENRFTQAGLSGIGDILTKDMFSGHKEGYTSDLTGGRYRPLSQITFAIEYQIFGLNPQFSHFINVILFALTPFMIFLLLSLLLKSDFKNFNWTSSIPFITALLFAVHPIHTEVVANIKGRDEIMSLLLATVSFYYFLKYIDLNQKKHIIISTILFFLALMSKENSITYLAVIPLTLIMFRERSVLTSVKSIIPLIVSGIIFIIIRQSIVGTASGNITNELMNEPFLGMTFSEKYGTIMVTLYEYLRLMIVPYPLTYDYYPYHIEKTSLLDFVPIFAIIIHILILGHAIQYFKKDKIVSFAILYYFITLSIVSNLFFTIGSFMNERFIFMPSIAVCIIVAYLFTEKLNKKFENRNLTIGLILVVAGIFSMITVTRNPVWKDNFTLMTNDVKTSSNSAFGNYTAGIQYYLKLEKSQDVSERKLMAENAKKHLYRALEIYPNYSNAYITLGNTYFLYDKNVDSTINCYKKSYQIYPANYETSINLGRLFRENKKNLLEAEFYFNNCIKVNPNKFEAYNELGVVYFQAGNFDKAIMMFENALSRNPKYKQILMNLSASYKAKGDETKSQMYLEQANMLR
jgi:hypothetical protein